MLVEWQKNFQQIFLGQVNAALDVSGNANSYALLAIFVEKIAPFFHNQIC